MGYFSESDKQAFTLPPDKVHRFAALRNNILSHKTVALKTLQKFAGKTTSFSLLVPGAKLYTNAAYQAISKASRSHKPIPVSAAFKAELLHWKFLDSWDCFLPWKDERHTSVTIFSDVSNIGWGAVVRIPGKEEQHLRGYWDENSRHVPIAIREAKAILFTLESLNHAIVNSRLDFFVEDKVDVSSWENQVSRTPALSQVLQWIFQLSLRLNVALKVCFVPSALNPADLPSRALSDTDCKLSPLAWKLVQQSYGPHTLDLLALASNIQCDQHGNPLRFYAPFPNPGCSGVAVRFHADHQCIWKFLRLPTLRPHGSTPQVPLSCALLPHYYYSRSSGRVGVMLSRCNGFDRGEWPGQAVGLSLPVTPNRSRRLTWGTFNPVWEIRVGEDLKGRKDPSWEGGWEGTPQLSRARKPSGDWKRGVFRTPPGHDSSVDLEKGSVHQRKIKYSWNTCLLIQAVSTGNVITESSISWSYAPF